MSLLQMSFLGTVIILPVSYTHLEKQDRQRLIFMDLFFCFTAYMMEQKTKAM